MGRGPVSTGLRSDMSCPTWSESSLQHYPGRVEVAVQHPAATSAVKRADGKRDLIQCPTEVALLRRVCGENIDNQLTHPSPFVFRESSKLAPNRHRRWTSPERGSSPCS